MQPARRIRNRARERSTGILLIAGLLLLATGLVGFLPYAHLFPFYLGNEPPRPYARTEPPSLTTTPFRPQAPTATHIPTATPLPTPTPAPRPILSADVIEANRPITLRIYPNAALHGGQPLEITFVPGADCPFGDQRACLSLHRGGALSLLTIHSGVGGQSEAFRRAVEGSGLDSALFSLSTIQDNLRALEGAAVELHLGDGSRIDLTLVGVARIPPIDLAQYFALPVDQALDIAAFYNPALDPVLESDEPLLAFEICGWKVAGESGAEEFDRTTGSIYFGLLKRP